MKRRIHFPIAAIILLLFVVALIGVGVFWLKEDPLWTAVMAPAKLASSALQTAENEISAPQIDAAIEKNYEDNFKTSFQTEAAYVVDESGRVLFAQNEHERLYPASTTKLMTAYLAMQHTEDLDALITVAELTGCYEEDSILLYLEEGDQISMRDLITALLLYSYNDAATAIAMEVGGSLENFAALMNEQAKELGALDTHFVTPHGLHDENHYTTAYDLNLILQAVYQEEVLTQIMLMESATIQILRGEEQLTQEIENASFFVRGLYEVPTMEYVAGKTGYTSKAQSCLASAFSLNDRIYFSTIMKSEDASYMTAILLDYYFAPEALPKFSKTIPLMRELSAA